jgi:MoxR-like ATPase
MNMHTTTAITTADTRQELEAMQADLATLVREVQRVIVGQDRVIGSVITCLLAGGHGLLEGVPGLGKTLMIRTLARAVHLDFNRIQFTPDLMPADIVGTSVLLQAEGDMSGTPALQYQPGPIFANIVLADEINRATPKTQSALLEAMAEGTVTAAGHTRPLPDPFLVLATQNPLEMEGTYPLPEAQLDRFLLKVMVPFPSEEDLVTIMDRTTGADSVTASKVASADEIVEMQRLARAVPIAPHVTAYAVSVLSATHPDQPRASELVREYVRYGGSPRGAQALVTAGKIYALLDGRFNVSIDDIRAVAMPSLRHRIILNFEGEAEGITSEAVIRSVLDSVAAPSVE